MAHLVIVESPAKAKTIGKYLGPGFEVLASVGHVRDLPESRLGVDVEHGFALEYEPNEDRKKAIAGIARSAKK
ncbi:MAG: toprim domain-containing protein, partial [Actinomycetota bacterium]